MIFRQNQNAENDIDARAQSKVQVYWKNRSPSLNVPHS